MKVIDVRRLSADGKQTGEGRPETFRKRCPLLDHLELELSTRALEKGSENLLRRSELLLKEAESTLRRLKAISSD